MANIMCHAPTHPPPLPHLYSAVQVEQWRALKDLFPSLSPDEQQQMFGALQVGGTWNGEGEAGVKLG